MPFSVQLDVDADTEATLGALADRLAPLSGLKTVRQIGVVHHLSLGVYGELSTDRFPAALAKFAETLPPVVVRPANLGVFPGGVLFFAPVVTSELLEVPSPLSRRVFLLLRLMFRALPSGAMGSACDACLECITSRTRNSRRKDHVLLVAGHRQAGGHTVDSVSSGSNAVSLQAWVGVRSAAVGCANVRSCFP